MNNWIDSAESALNEIAEEDKIPFDFERWEESLRGDLPDNYIVYFLVSDPTASSADGNERLHSPRIQVSLFYRNKETLLTIPDRIINKLTQKGFRRSSTGRIPYQQNTGHYGWRSDFYYLERR